MPDHQFLGTDRLGMDTDTSAATGSAEPGLERHSSGDNNYSCDGTTWGSISARVTGNDRHVGGPAHAASYVTSASALGSPAVSGSGCGIAADDGRSGTSDAPLDRRIASSNTSAMRQPSRATAHSPPAQATAIRASNVMRLWSDASFRAQVNAQLRDGVPFNRRDALDGAGKFVVAAKTQAIGVTADQLFLDPAQAGGLLGKFDGMFADGSGIEVKASRSYRCGRSFQFARLRPDSPFQVRQPKTRISYAKYVPQLDTHWPDRS